MNCDICLTKSFQADRDPRERGPSPLNSHRWRGASRRPNGQGVKCTPGVRRGAGQPVVQPDHRRLQSDASVRLISCSAG